MASAWGNSWGSAWGNSWGQLTPDVPVHAPVHTGGMGQLGELRRGRSRLHHIYAEGIPSTEAFGRPTIRPEPIVVPPPPVEVPPPEPVAKPVPKPISIPVVTEPVVRRKKKKKKEVPIVLTVAAPIIRDLEEEEVIKMIAELEMAGVFEEEH